MRLALVREKQRTSLCCRNTGNVGCHTQHMGRKAPLTHCNTGQGKPVRRAHGSKTEST